MQPEVPSGFLSERDWSQARLAAQYAVAEVLSNADDLRPTLEAVLRVVGEHLKFSAGAVYLVENDSLRWFAGWNAAGLAAEAFLAVNRKTAFPKGYGLPGNVWATGSPAWIEVLASNSIFTRTKEAEAARLRSGVAFPLVRCTEVAGVIEYFSTAVRSLESTLLETLTAVTLQVRQFLERKRAEEALVESEAQHRILFENANDAFGVSVDEHFVVVNQAFANVFGYNEAQEMIGVSIYENLPPAQRAVVREHRQRRLAGLPEPMRYQSRGLRVDGSEFLSEVRATDYWIGGRMFTLAILRDVTVERHAQDVLTQSNAALMRANADLEQFAYAASHDLQEPLRMILLYAQLLERRHYDDLSEDGRQLLGTVTGGALRINELVRDLLSYTRTATMDATTAPAVDPNEVIQEVRGTFREHIVKSGAVVTSDTLPMLRVHRTHIVQLFQNLLSNALKYQRPDVAPIIHLASKKNDGSVELQLRDNGIGILPEYHERIFGVFKRLHSQRVPGTGMGLAICKRIVEHYNGDIWVTSTPDVGSTFHVKLPAGEVEA